MTAITDPCFGLCLCFPASVLRLSAPEIFCVLFWCPFKVYFLSYGLVLQICGVHVDRCMCVSCVSMTVCVCVCPSANLCTVIECAAVGTLSSVPPLQHPLSVSRLLSYALSFIFSFILILSASFYPLLLPM